MNFIQNSLGAMSASFSSSPPNQSAGEGSSGSSESSLTPQIIVQSKDGSSSLRKYVTILPGSADSGSRSTNHVVLVIDVSGSMGLSADTGDEKTGLTILDITKHAAKTTINLLGENDRCSIIEFTTAATIISKDILMNDAGKKLSIAKLEDLHPKASTNIWGGLYEAMELIKSVKHTNCFSTILLLTDGIPNVNPPCSTHLESLKQYKDNNKSVDFSLYTFGFGYTLDSPLLTELSLEEGSGSYSFIPDAGMVGTVFVHAISNILVTYGQKAQIAFEVTPPQQGSYKISRVLGGYDATIDNTSGGAIMPIGSLFCGQSRTFVVDLERSESDVIENSSANGNDILSAKLTYIGNTNGKVGTVSVRSTALSSSSSDDVDLQLLLPSDSSLRQSELRLLSVEAMTSAMEGVTIQTTNNLSAAQGVIESVISLFEPGEFDDLLTDMKGEVRTAVADCAAFNKWGKHYLPSLLRSHQLQICSNFKDPGMQNYGGSIFQKLRDEADDIFMTLPPPKPSGEMRGSSGAPIASMRSYNNSAGPCFAPQSRVKMADGSFKPCEQLKKGDAVATTPNGRGTSKVRCVIKTLCENNESFMVRLGDLLVTPYHPVRINGTWTFPIDLARGATIEECPAIYSFILESGHILIIDGIECIGLAHNIKDDPVATHEFFGTDMLIENLKPLGLDSGLIVFNYNCCIRDTSTADARIFSFDASRLVMIESAN